MHFFLAISYTSDEDEELDDDIEVCDCPNCRGEVYDGSEPYDGNDDSYPLTYLELRALLACGRFYRKRCRSHARSASDKYQFACEYSGYSKERNITYTAGRNSARAITGTLYGFGVQGQEKNI